MADSPERARSYFISSGTATEGPFDLATLREEVAAGRIDRRYQIWDDDAGSWAPFSALEDLLRTPGRTKPVRAPKNPRSSTAAAAAGPSLSEAELLGGIVPRVVSQRIGGTYAPEAPTPEIADEPPETPMPSGAAPEPGPRRRNYSPMSAGANAARPFSPVKAAAEEQSVGIEPVEPAAAGWPMARRAVWPAAAVCVGLCVLGLLALRIAGLVTFGVHVHEEHLRLREELAATKQRLASKEQALKRVLAQRESYSNQFTAAQGLVRDIRTSLFAATKRELQLGNGPAVDQRLFELDQLNRLVAENEAEGNIHRELVDAFFGLRAREKAPAGSPAP